MNELQRACHSRDLYSPYSFLVVQAVCTYYNAACSVLGLRSSSQLQDTSVSSKGCTYLVQAQHLGQAGFLILLECTS